MNRKQPIVVALITLTIIGTASAADTPNWPQWRGPQENGSISGGQYATKWSPDNVLWKTELPGKGCSTPVVWDRTIFLTAPIDGRDAVLAFDWNGKPLWKTLFGTENQGKHRNGSGSNASPVTDGKGVFVYFKSGTLAALNNDGTIRWQTNLVDQYGPDSLFWDHGTSPVLTEDSLIMTRMHHGESWLAAFDKQTGRLKWKVERNYETPVEGDHGYTTPLIIQHQGQEAILVWGAENITVHDPSDGRVIWFCGEFNPEANGLWPAIATPVIANDIVVIAAGRNDRGIPRLHGIRMGGKGDVTETHRIWKRNDVGTFVPTPIEYQGRVYIVRDRGEVECINPTTGKTIWSGAFPKGRPSFYASPIIAGDKLYAAREDGTIFVAKLGDDFELVATNDMQQPVIASLVPSENRLLIRGENHLFCVGPNE